MMKHFVKIEPGALKTQRPSPCQVCSRTVDRMQDHFLLEAHWSIKRKADKISFCSIKCLTKWAHS